MQKILLIIAKKAHFIDRMPHKENTNNTKIPKVLHISKKSSNFAGYSIKTDN
jgi:hypothetical protein